MKYEIFLSLLFMGVMVSCKDDTTEEKTCCSIPAVDAQVGNGHAYVPNVFTPNGDGINEQFFGMGTFIKAFEMHIFDRWGNKIFESNDLYKGWNGKVKSAGDIVQEDVYVWKVRVTDFEGKHYNYNGHVSVIK